MKGLSIGSGPSPVFKTGRGRGRFRRLRRVLLWALLAAFLLGSIQAWLNRPETMDLPPASEVLAGWRDHLNHDLTQHPSPPAGRGPGFAVADPYAFPGTWFKVQLHSHTNHSLDGRWSIAESLAAYREAGYDFVAISDHDRVTRPAESPASPLLIPAEENTLSFPVWPFGHHAIMLFIDEPIRGRGARLRFSRAREAGGLVSIAHPSWIGNLGTGRWEMRHLMVTEDFTLMEVYNPYSDPDADTAIWHEAVLRRGPQTPVWAVAVDDAHDLKNFNKGWTMVKAEARTLEALKQALQRGSLYATTGPAVTFGVDAGAIFTAPAETGTVLAAPRGAGTSEGPSERYEVGYINAAGETVYAWEGDLATRYEPRGDEGFIRVEVVNTRTGKRAWSQPFWLMPVSPPAAPVSSSAQGPPEAWAPMPVQETSFRGDTTR